MEPFGPLILFPRDGWLWLFEPRCGELIAQGRHMECGETVRDVVEGARRRALSGLPRPLVQAASSFHAAYLAEAFAAAAAGDRLEGDRWTAERQRELFGAYWRLRAA
jgi:hypothetical protein